MVQWAVWDITSSDNVGASGSSFTRQRSSESPYRCRATTCTLVSAVSTVSHASESCTRRTEGRHPCSVRAFHLLDSHIIHTPNALHPPRLAATYHGAGARSARRVRRLQYQLPHGKPRLQHSRCRRRLPGALAHGRAARPRHHRAHHRRTHAVAAHACTGVVAMSQEPVWPGKRRRKLFLRTLKGETSPSTQF